MTPANYKNKDVWQQICSTTLSNYTFMEKRLNSNKKISEFVLTYYSIFLIINSLTPLFFGWYSKNLSNYFGIILSIILLAFSLVNSNAHYSKRIDTVTNAINALKTLKRELTDDNIEDFKKKYNSITDNVEIRSDIDFFRTIKCKCKETGVHWYEKPSKIVEDDKLRNYLSEISPFSLQTKIILTKILYFFLFIFPILVISLCIIF